MSPTVSVPHPEPAQVLCLAVLVQEEVGTHWVRSGVVGGGSFLCKGHWELGVWQAEEQSSIRLATLSTEWGPEHLLGKD